MWKSSGIACAGGVASLCGGEVVCPREQLLDRGVAPVPFSVSEMILIAKGYAVVCSPQIVGQASAYPHSTRMPVITTFHWVACFC